MIIRCIGAAEQLSSCTLAALVNTSRYLSQNNISDYVTSYFGDEYKLTITKSPDASQFIVTTQISFNTIIFYQDNATPIGYCILDNPIDMIYLGINNLTIDLSYITINSILNTYINISTTDFQPHNITNLHPSMASVSARKDNIPTKYKKVSPVSSNIQESILRGGMTRLAGNVCIGNKYLPPSLINSTLSSNPLSDITNILSSDPLIYKGDFRWWIDNGYHKMFNLNNESSPNAVLDLEDSLLTYDANSDTDFSNHSTRHIIGFRDFTVKIFDAGIPESREYWIYDNEEMGRLNPGSGNLCDGSVGLSTKVSFSDTDSIFGLTRNLITDEMGFYFKSNNKIEKIYPLKLERLLFELHLTSSISRCSHIWGYTDNSIIYSVTEGTTVRNFLVTDAPINNSKKLELPSTITKVEALSNRAFLICDGTYWKLIKLSIGNSGYTSKTYYLGNNVDGWRKLDLILTLPRTIEYVGNIYVDDPLMTPVDGLLNVVINSNSTNYVYS